MATPVDYSINYFKEYYFGATLLSWRVDFLDDNISWRGQEDGNFGLLIMYLKQLLTA